MKILDVAFRASPVLALFCLGLSGAGICSGPESFELGDVPKAKQLESNWCWAASGEMTMEAVSTKDIEQCEEASNATGNACCQKPRPGCNKVGWPDYDHYDFDAEAEDDGLEWTQIRREIFCNKRPFAFATFYPGKNSGHMVVAVGYGVSTKHGKYISTIDPRDTSDLKLVPYAEYIGGYPYNSEHWRTYYKIRQREAY